MVKHYDDFYKMLYTSYNVYKGLSFSEGIKKRICFIGCLDSMKTVKGKEVLNFLLCFYVLPRHYLTRWEALKVATLIDKKVHQDTTLKV